MGTGLLTDIYSPRLRAVGQQGGVRQMVINDDLGTFQ